MIEGKLVRVNGVAAFVAAHSHCYKPRQPSGATCEANRGDTPSPPRPVQWYTFPACPRSYRPPTRCPVTNAFPLPNATVLVVDDEPLARRIATRILSEEGYRVWEADGRDEALQVLGEARGRVGLVLLDVVMPRCDGVETGRDILAEWPDQRILYM